MFGSNVACQLAVSIYMHVLAVENKSMMFGSNVACQLAVSISCNDAC